MKNAANAVGYFTVRSNILKADMSATFRLTEVFSSIYMGKFPHISNKNSRRTEKNIFTQKFQVGCTEGYATWTFLENFLQTEF